MRQNHSTMPQCVGFQRRCAYGWKRSAAKTPIWHVTDESTRMIVLTVAYGMFSSSALERPQLGDVLRSVK